MYSADVRLLSVHFVSFSDHFKAVVIQSLVRGWLVRKKHLRFVQSVIKCQCAVRRHLAKNRFKELKREARSMEHMKKLNKGLENKIISMQQRIGEMVTIKIICNFSVNFQISSVANKIDNFTLISKKN